MTQLKRPRRAGPGKTLPQLAEAYKGYLSESQLRRAKKRGDVHFVEFAGLNICTPTEERRMCALLEIPFADETST